jgi:hypothetical protein
LIHEVLLAPGCGYGGDAGFDPGHRCRTMHEFNILDGFVRDLCDAMELQRIRHKVLPVLNSPGIEPDERWKHFEANQLVVNLRLGWDPPSSAGTNNWSQVQHGDFASVKLARTLTDAVGQWGRCHVYGHQTRNPRRDRKDPLLNREETAGVRIIPFALNGPRAWEYATRLKSLAQGLVWAFKEYLGDDACSGKPFKGMEAPPTPSPTGGTFAGLPEWVLKDPAD